MQFAQEFGEARYRIRGYDETSVTVNETVCRASLWLTPDELHEGWAVDHAEALDEAALAPLLATRPEVVVIGTGRRCLPPSPRWLRFFAGRGVGVEFMDTPAACRTFNVLMAEGRRVACGLIVEPPPPD
jgi:uncharacterized protein